MGAARSLKVVLFCLGVLGTARAEEPTRVTIYSECASAVVRVSEVAEILGAELSPAPVEMVERRPSALGVGGILVIVDDCRDEPVSVRASVISSGVRKERLIDLSDVDADARARTLAIALTETIRPRPAPEAPLARRSAPADPSQKTSSAPSPRRARPKRDAQTPTAIRGHVAGVFRLALDTTTPLVGAEGGARFKRFAGGALFLGGQRSTPLGAARVFAFTTTAGFDILPFRAGAVFGRGELGVALASGSPRGAATASSGARPHVALALGFRAAFSLGAGVSLETTLDAGLAASVTAQVAHHDEASLGIWFVSATLGVGFW